MSTVNLKTILLDIRKRKLPLEDLLKDIDDKTARNETFFGNAVKLNGEALKYASDVIKDNDQIVKSAVRSSCWALEHASDRLKSDENIVLESLRVRSNLYDNYLAFPQQLLTSRDFILKLIEANPYNIKFIPKTLREDAILYASAIAADSSILESRLRAFDEETYKKLYLLLENKDIATEVILKNVYVFNYLSAELKTHEEFVLNLINRLVELEPKGGITTCGQKRDLLTSIIQCNRNNEGIVLASLKHTMDDSYLGEIIFRNISQDLYSDIDFISRAMKANGFLIKYIPHNLKDNKAIFLSALNNLYKRERRRMGNDSPLLHASDSLRQDIDVVTAAIRTDGKAIAFVSEKLRNNVDLVLESLHNGAGLNYFKYLPLKLQNRKNLILALKNGGGLVDDIPINLRSDKEIVMYAVMDYGKNLCQASIELKNDKAIVLAAVTSCGEVLENASHQLRNDVDIVLAAVSQNGAALKFASEELKNNFDVALTAVRNKHAHILNSNLPALAYVGNVLKNDKEIILESFEGGGIYDILKNELVPPGLLTDKDFVLKLINKDATNFIKYYWRHLPSQMKNDLDIYTLKLIG
jgi:hypothetical protein